MPSLYLGGGGADNALKSPYCLQRDSISSVLNDPWAVIRDIAIFRRKDSYYKGVMPPL